jgi:hypothetical protein
MMEEDPMAAVMNVKGTWIAHQSNGANVTFNLDRQDLLLTGSASVSPGGAQSQTLNGRISDTQFLVTVKWNANSTGEYNGTFGIDGRLTGHTFDVNNPSSQAFWFSDRGFSLEQQ